MNTLISLLIVVAAVSVLIWLIQQITFGPSMLKSILIAIAVIAGILKVWPMLK